MQEICANWAQGVLYLNWDIQIIMLFYNMQKYLINSRFCINWLIHNDVIFDALFQLKWSQYLQIWNFYIKRNCEWYINLTVKVCLLDKLDQTQTCHPLGRLPGYPHPWLLFNTLPDTVHTMSSATVWCNFHWLFVWVK